MGHERDDLLFNEYVEGSDTQDNDFGYLYELSEMVQPKTPEATKSVKDTQERYIDIFGKIIQ
jgi:hypothetical protein